MEQNSLPQNQYSRLGKKVFWLFFAQMCPLCIILLLVSIVAFVMSFQASLASTFLGNIQPYALGASGIIFFLFLLSLFVTLGSAWISYISYTFMLAEDSLKIKKGILNKTEIAIPYRQVQNVDIERDFMFQMMGLSRLIILTAGHEDEKSEGGGPIRQIDRCRFSGLIFGVRKSDVRVLDRAVRGHRIEAKRIVIARARRA